MDIKDHPVFTSIIITLALSLFYLFYWTGDKQRDVDAPTHVRTMPTGQIAVLMGTDIYIENEAGVTTDIFNLGQLGIDQVIGDFAFFSNGDLLVRAGERQQSRDSVKAHLRNADDEAGSGYLVRCDLDKMSCDRWSSEISFNRTFRLHIDNDEYVYIADTARDQLLKFSPDGKLLAKSKSYARWPNQLFAYAESLYVALSDGKNPGVQVYSAETEHFGKHLFSFNQLPEDAVRSGRQLISDIMRVGDSWWINAMKSGQKYGAIYLFSQDWHFQKKLALPDNADPLMMTYANNKVYIVDPSLFRMFTFTSTGDEIQRAENSQLDRKLSKQRAQHSYYQNLNRLSLIGFIALLVGGFYAAYRISIQSLDHLKHNQKNLEWTNLNDPAIKWLEFASDFSSKIRAMQYGLVIILLGIMAGFIWLGYPIQFFLLLIPFALLGVVLGIHINRLMKHRIGIRGQAVILVDKHNRSAKGEGADICYSDHFIMIGDVIVPTGNQQQSYFSKEVLIKEVYPLLKDSLLLTNMQIQILNFRKTSCLRKIAVLLPFAGIILVVAYLGGYLDDWISDAAFYFATIIM